MNIVTLGGDILRQKAVPVTDIDKEIAHFSHEMLVAMHRNKGIGLAGPQVGALQRIFVVHIEGDIPRVFINPSIIKTSHELITLEEGCLSIPGIYADVRRPEYITIQAWNEKGHPITLDADGLLARVIQHEYDHLEGILFIDRLSEVKKKRIITQFEKNNRVK
jgi:peptide deformylase